MGLGRYFGTMLPFFKLLMKNETSKWVISEKKVIQIWYLKGGLTFLKVLSLALKQKQTMKFSKGIIGGLTSTCSFLGNNEKGPRTV